MFETPDHALFDFGTTGTMMSMLSDESPSIRKASIQLQERFEGVWGIFDCEID